MPLQAADLLAYETYQYSLKKLMYGSYLLKPEMDLAMALARAKDFGNDFKLFDRRGMEVALSDFREENPELCSIPDSDVSAGASV
jgi:hypothetical protein